MTLRGFCGVAGGLSGRSPSVAIILLTSFWHGTVGCALRPPQASWPAPPPRPACAAGAGAPVCGAVPWPWPDKPVAIAKTAAAETTIIDELREACARITPPLASGLGPDCFYEFGPRYHVNTGPADTVLGDEC